MRKTIFVTGGAGFIGSALIRHLISETFHRIVNVDKLTYAGNLESLPEKPPSERYQFIREDIKNRREITEIIFKVKPDYIIHLAAESHVDRSIDGPSEFLETNILGTFNLLEAAKEYYQTLDREKQDSFRFHNVSTDEVYGDLDAGADSFTEHTPYQPSSPYSATKAGGDHLVRAWGRTYGLPVIVTNCSNNYGPHQFPEKLIPHVILNALNARPLPLYGDGLQIRDWLYVNDHARALREIMDHGEVGQTYNIGGHNEKTNLEVVETICDLLEELGVDRPAGVKSYKDLITFVQDRPGHDTRYAVDASKIKSQLGWVPQETFNSGLRKTVQWYLKNRFWWERVLSGAYRLQRFGDYRE